MSRTNLNSQRNVPGKDAAQLQAWLEPIMEAVDADAVVSDDADALKAEVAGISRSEFLASLSRFQVSPFQYGVDEIADEAKK